MRQWKKDTKAKYSLLVEQKARLGKVLEESEKRLENEKLEQKYAKEERLRQEIQRRERNEGGKDGS